MTVIRLRRRRPWLRLDGLLMVATAGTFVVLWMLTFAAGWLMGMERRLPAGRSAGFQPAPEIEPPPVPRIERVAYVEVRPAPQVIAPVVYEFRPAVVHIPPQPATLASLIADASIRRAIPEQLVNAIIRVESDFDPLEVSHKGAMGLMQVMPATGERFGVRRYELFDPERNIAAGTAYLAWLLDRYDGDLDRTLAAYNAGEGAVDRYDGIPPYPETREYVKRVRAHLRRAQPEVY